MANKQKKITHEQREAIRVEVYGRLNIKTGFTPYEGEGRTSSFSEEPAAWKRGNRLYSQAEYERTNARRVKLEARANKLIEDQITALEKGEEVAKEVEAEAVPA